MPKYLSGKNRVLPVSELSADRYRYLSLNQAEPNLGDPLVGPSSIGAKTVPLGNNTSLFLLEQLREKDSGFLIKVELYLDQSVFLIRAH